MISDRLTLALQVSISMVLAVAASLALNWDEPKWAMLAVSVCVLGTGGESLLKGAYRLGGTVVGATVALIFLSLFTQFRWAYLLALLTWIGFCCWRMNSTRRWYFWLLAAFVVPLMTLYSGFVPEEAFEIVMIRMQQTSLGVIVFTIVSSLLFPNKALKNFRATLIDRINALRQQFDAITGLYRSGDAELDPDCLRPLQSHVLQSHVELQDKLDAASLESLEIMTNRETWAQMVHDLLLIEDRLTDWQLGFQDILATAAAPPDVTQVLTEIDRRLQATGDLISGRGSDVTAMRVTVPVEHIHTKDPFYSGALTLSMRTLSEIEIASARLLEAAQCIVSHNALKDHSPSQLLTLPRSIIPDPDLLDGLLRLWFNVSVAFMALIFIPALPSGGMVVILPVVVGLFLSRMPSVPVGPIGITGILALFFATILHIIIMPKVTSYLGLGIALFFYSFAAAWLLYAPKVTPVRFQALVFMALVINLDNQNQTYSFLYSPNFAIAFIIPILLLIFTTRFPVRLTPRGSLDRLLKRYVSSAMWLLNDFATGRNAPQSWWRTQQRRHHIRQVYRIPALLEPWIPGLPDDLGQNGQTVRVESLLRELDTLARWLDTMIKTHEWSRHPKADQVLAQDLAEWLESVRQASDQLINRPGTLDLDVLEARFQDRIKRLQLATDLALSEEDDISDPRREQTALELIHELVIFRGVSRALLNIAEPVQKIDWVRMRETRF